MAVGALTRLAGLGWALAMQVEMDPGGTVALSPGPEPGGEGGAPPAGESPSPAPAAPPAPPVVDMAYFIAHGLSSQEGGGVGPRLFETIRQCGVTETLAVPVWAAAMSTAQAECVPFELVVRGARLAMVKLQAADTTRSFKRLVSSAARTAASRGRDKEAVASTGNTFSQFRSNAYTTLGQFSSKNKGLVERLPTWLGRGLLEDAARDVRWVQDSGVVIQEVLFSHDGRSTEGRPERFYRRLVAAAHGLGTEDPARVSEAVEYLAELGGSAGAVDAALFHDFTTALIDASVGLVEAGEAPSLTGLYQAYCAAHPAGPLGPGPPVDDCVPQARAVNAFLVFAFGVLDPLHSIVASAYAPVCGTAAQEVQVTRVQPGGFMPTCARGEEGWLQEHGRPPCCCAFTALEEENIDSEELSHLRAEDLGALQWSGAQDWGEMLHLHATVVYRSRTAGTELPVRTCTAARLEGFATFTVAT